MASFCVDSTCNRSERGEDWVIGVRSRLIEADFRAVCSSGALFSYSEARNAAAHGLKSYFLLSNSSFSIISDAVSPAFSEKAI